jgi:hypothetical protein
VVVGCGGVLLLVVLVGAPAAGGEGGHAPERAQARARRDLVPKVALACGRPLTMTYDLASLRRNNLDIRLDQSGGEAECNEPLRYLWYACQTPAGKAAVKSAHITKVVCQGVSEPEGSIAFIKGTIVVGRSAEERRSFIRSRGQFEAMFEIQLGVSVPDPADDRAWNDRVQRVPRSEPGGQ